MWWSPEYQPYCDGSIQRSSWKISSDAPPTEKRFVCGMYSGPREAVTVNCPSGRLMLWPSCR